MRYRIFVLISVCLGLLLMPGVNASAGKLPREIRKQVKALRSAKVEVRRGAIRELAVSDVPEATEVLIAHLEDEEDIGLKITIIESLPLHQSTTTAQALITALDDVTPAVRQAALVALGYFGDSASIAQAIAQSLEDEENEAVQLSAVNTLRQHRNTKAVETLGTMLRDDKNGKLHGSIQKALRKIDTEDAAAEIERYEAALLNEQKTEQRKKGERKSKEGKR